MSKLSKFFLPIMIFCASSVFVQAQTTVSDKPLVRALVQDKNEKRPLEILITLVNDSGIVDGDDDHYTHGMSISAVKRLKSGYSLTLSYNTDLYTQRLEDPIPDDEFSQQYFTNDNVVRIIFDNLQQGKLTYWKVGAGWRRLSNEDAKSLFNASGQQDKFHASFGRLERNEYLKDGAKTKQGPEAEAAYGVQGMYKKGPVTFRTASGVNSRASTVKGASFVGIDVDQSILWKNSILDVSFNLGSSLKHHKEGEEFNPYLSAGIGTERFTMDLRKTYYKGDVMNYQRYNNPGLDGKYEPIYTLQMKYSFY